MVEERVVAGGEDGCEGPDHSPQRLMYEAASLALILCGVLALSSLDRVGYAHWRAYSSSFLLFALAWWHAKHFRIGIRLFRPRSPGRVFPLASTAALVLLILVSAVAPLAPRLGRGPSFVQMLHLLLLVPLSEELYFRGLLLEHLRRGFGTVWAVVLSSLLFALLHLPTGGAVVTGGLSLIACLLVLRGGGLGYAIQLHAAWNALSQIHRLGHTSPRWIWAIAASVIIVALAAGPLMKRVSGDSKIRFA